MSMTTPSGLKTYKYDADPGSEAMLMTDNLVNSMDAYKKEVNQKMESLEDKIDAARRATLSTDQRVDGVLDDLQCMRVLLYAFLRSPLVRFFNFFGCWFIYPKAEGVYPNEPKYAEYGTVPLLTRIRRWFQEHFPKRDEE